MKALGAPRRPDELTPDEREKLQRNQEAARDFWESTQHLWRPTRRAPGPRQAAPVAYWLPPPVATVPVGPAAFWSPPKPAAGCFWAQQQPTPTPAPQPVGPAAFWSYSK